MTSDPEDTTSFLAAAVEASPGAIVAVDLEGRIVNWNTAAEKLLGFSTDDVVGQTLMSLVPEDAREAAETILARVRVGERRSKEKRDRKWRGYDGTDRRSSSASQWFRSVPPMERFAAPWDS